MKVMVVVPRVRHSAEWLPLKTHSSRKCEATSETSETWSLASSRLCSRVELQMVRMVGRWKIKKISAGYGGRGSGEAEFEYIM